MTAPDHGLQTLRGEGNLANVEGIDEPLLILIGAKDETTPPSLSRALFAAGREPVERKHLVVLLGAGHNDVLRHDEDLDTYMAFVRSL